MRCAAIVLVLLVILISVASAGTTLQIVPTTTLSAEMGNNTSASNLFLPTSNGDLGPGNVSKVDTHTLLYPGFTGKILAHLMGWFCMQPGSTSTGAGTSCNSHVQVGYDSPDPAVVHAQVADMISRGFDGVIHDWYGPRKSRDDEETKNWIAEAEQHPGFQVALMIDKGALEWYSCMSSGCTSTEALTQITQYAAKTFFDSPAYLRINGRPVLTNFDIDLHYPDVDWNYVAANTPGNPIFLFQNSGGFTHLVSSGSYSWVMPGNSNYGLDYLAGFYAAGMHVPSVMMVGAVYKGFNDSLAGWSGNRSMSQQCGQTWLQTFAQANSKFNSSYQLPAVQVVTWDDYEEGTEIETGIDNCVSVSSAVTGSLFSWTITGSEDTIDHYTVFISSDGQSLMPLGDFPAGTRQFDLASFALAPGTYTLYVKAIGKPSLRNQMSGAATYTVAGVPPLASLSLSASTAFAPSTITVSISASDSNPGGEITSTLINWGDGSTSDGLSGTHLYRKAGAYTVTATVTDNFGQSVTAAGSITVKAPAIYITSPGKRVTMLAPVHVTAYAVSGLPISAIIVYLDYKEVYRTYSASVDTTLEIGPGKHLLVTNAWDSSGTLMQAHSIIIVPGPTIALSASMSGATVTASTAASRDAGAAITSSQIIWGDGTSSPGPTATHTYAQAGEYAVTGMVTDSFGLLASKSVLVTATAP